VEVVFHAAVQLFDKQFVDAWKALSGVGGVADYVVVIGRELI
jgi:hypothetical protein